MTAGETAIEVLMERGLVESDEGANLYDGPRPETASEVQTENAPANEVSRR